MEEHAPAAAATAKPVPIPQILIEPPTPTPPEIDTYNWDWSIRLSRGDLKIRTAQPGVAGVRGRSGLHRRIRQHISTGHRLCGETNEARNTAADAEEGGRE